VNFSEDNLEIHPPNFCRKCYSAVSNLERRGNSNRRELFHWTPHHTETCLTCTKTNKERPKTNKSGVKKTTQTKSFISEADVANLSPSKPIPAKIAEFVSKVISIKIKQSTLPNNTVQLPTKGSQVSTHTIYIYISLQYTLLILTVKCLG
jgi:hypothetical protein